MRICACLTEMTACGDWRSCQPQCSSAQLSSAQRTSAFIQHAVHKGGTCTAWCGRRGRGGGTSNKFTQRSWIKHGCVNCSMVLQRSQKEHLWHSTAHACGACMVIVSRLNMQLPSAAEHAVLSCEQGAHSQYLSAYHIIDFAGSDVAQAFAYLMLWSTAMWLTRWSAHLADRPAVSDNTKLDRPADASHSSPGRAPRVWLLSVCICR